MKHLTLLYVFLLGMPFYAASQEKKLVVASASIFADMTRNIAGDAFEVKTIVPIGGDPHIYDPTPGDAALAASADLILKNGLTFEGWLDELIANSGTKARIVTITEGIEPIRSVQYKNSSDPHAWMSASNGLIYIKNIKNALVQLDPSNQKMFEFNYEVYKNQLLEMDGYISKKINEIPIGRRILITSHDAFRYYGNRYGITVESILGTSTDAEAQTSDIRRLNKIIQEKQVPAVFIETTVNPKLLEQIAKDNKVIVGGKLFSDSIGDENSEAPSYLDMLKYNTDTILKGLNSPPSQETETSVEGKKVGRSYLLWAIMGAAIFIGGFWFVFSRVNG